MAEDKTFRYGLIVLGFFLIMIGMFIMSVERPQVFVTFCTIGTLLVVVGITWSICQCYPKITFVPVETESESFLSEKSPSSFNSGFSEKKCSQTPYTSAEEASRYEKSLPSYDQLEIKVVGSAESPGLQSVPTTLKSEMGSSSTPLPARAKVVVHRDSESDEDTTKNVSSKGTSGEAMGQPERRKEAPLASFHEDANASSSDESSGSSSGQPVHTVLNSVFMKQRKMEELIGGPPCYEAIALIDSLQCEEEQPMMDQGSITFKSNMLTTANHRDFSQVMAPELMTSSRPDVQLEDDFYYGLKEESDNLLADESDLEA